MDSPLQHAFRIVSTFEQAPETGFVCLMPATTRKLAELTEARDKQIINKIEEIARQNIGGVFSVSDYMRKVREFFSRMRKPSMGVNSAKELIEMARKAAGLPDTLDTHGHDADHKARYAQIRISELEAEVIQQRVILTAQGRAIDEQEKTASIQLNTIKHHREQLDQWNRIAEYANQNCHSPAGDDIPNFVYNSLVSWVNYLKEQKANPAQAPWANRDESLRSEVLKLRQAANQLREERDKSYADVKNLREQIAIWKMNLELSEKQRSTLLDRIRHYSGAPSNGWVLRSKYEAAQRSLEILRAAIRNRVREIGILQEDLKQAKIMAFLPSNEKSTFKVYYKTNKLAATEYVKDYEADCVDHALDQFRKTHPYFYVKKVVVLP